MQYLPDREQLKAASISRDYIFAIINTLDSAFFPDAIAELETWRERNNAKKTEQVVEIDSEMLKMLESIRSGSGRSKGRGSLGALLVGSKKRKAPSF